MNTQPKHLNDGDKWILAEDIPDIDFQFSQIWLSSFVNNLESTLGMNYKKVMSIYDGYNLKFYYGEKDSEQVSQAILDKILSEGFGQKINQEIRTVADQLEELTKELEKDRLKAKSPEELSTLYATLDEVHTTFYAWCWLPNAVDMFHPHFTEHLKSVLREKLESEAKVNEALVALSFWPEKSFVQEETESLTELAMLKAGVEGASGDFEELLKQHHEKYFFLKHLWIGKDGVSTMDEYRQMVDELIAQEDPKALREQEEQIYTDAVKARDHWKAELNLTDDQQAIFDVYAEFAFTKTYRRRVQLLWAYKMDFLFEELAERFGISFMEARFLLPEEVANALAEGLSDELKGIVSERVKHCVYYAEKDLDVVTIGAECEMFEKTLVKEEVGDIKEVKGQVACLGRVEGVVKIVNVPEDMAKVNDGDILVSIATNPDIVPAMKKAAAFVTEQGGITSHAAIVAREMAKPCVIGTKIATQVFKDGDRVEVDAENGIVRLI